MTRIILGIALLFYFRVPFCIAQNKQLQFKFVLIDKESKLPAITISAFLVSNTSVYYNSNLKGELTINSTASDSLIIKSLEYKETKISLTDYDPIKANIIQLTRNNLTLDEVNIEIRNPISEQFSVSQLNAMDIYLDPFASGDILKAVNGLASSSNTDENANPALRGSDENRSIVILNKVPIYKPVRNSQLNGIGNFSIFNTELLDKQYVYASNPPLIFGNSSAGLVELTTVKKIDKDGLQVNLSLVGAGIFASKKINRNAFIQLFSNVQYSDLLKKINKDALTLVNDFNSIDIGTNIHYDINKKSSLNSIAYFIDEGYQGEQKSFNYKGTVNSKNKRFYTVNNYEILIKDNSSFDFNLALNTSKTNYYFGNINSINHLFQTFASANYKFHLSNFRIQSGASIENSNSEFSNINPLKFYQMKPTDSTNQQVKILKNQNIELYTYSTYKFNSDAIISAGIRKNIPVKWQNSNYNKQPSYLSTQLSFRYHLNKHHSLLASVGKYYNTTLPSYYNLNFNVLSSSQYALDYSYSSKNWNFILGTYYKKEDSRGNGILEIDNYRKGEILGIETTISREISKMLSIKISNTFLNHKIWKLNNHYKGKSDLNYFIKASATYSNFKLFNISATYISRPGIFTTPIISTEGQSPDLIPIFDEKINSYPLNPYNNLSITLNKYFVFNKIPIIAYLVTSNIFNRNNQSNFSYYDYPKEDFTYFQKRLFFMGFTIKF
ncbi:TonB-dependent receptor plug domain-containing protein [Sphingobacterium kitahiroshimense]|uniref:TonB-dependent receptor n=1 Tax=Sphingobacterium kitahiroshimense TaxID=470446 RepID=A0ABV0BVF0_9SPHI